MPNINIEIPDDVHRRLKVAAAVQDVTLKDLIILVLEKNAGKKAPSLDSTPRRQVGP
jgi:predicted HicB family RNase H-like nuclease